MWSNMLWNREIVEGSCLYKNADARQMNVSHYHSLCLLEKSRFTHKSAQKITGNGNVHIIEHVVPKKHCKSVVGINAVLLKFLPLAEFSFVGIRTVQVIALLKYQMSL